MVALLNPLLFSHQSKRRRTHTQTRSSSPWKKTTALLGNTGERKCSGLWSPQSQFYPSTLAPSLICAQISSLWQGRSSALPPSSQPLQLTNKWSRITSNRNSKQEEVPPHNSTSTTVKHKILFFSPGFLGRPGCYLCRTLYCMCLIWHCGVIWEAGFFRFKGFRGVGVLKLQIRQSGKKKKIS